MASSYIVLGIELPWIYPLADQLSVFGHTVGVSLGAWRYVPSRKMGVPFSVEDGKGLAVEVWRYPPGFSRRLAPLFARRIRNRVGRLVERVAETSGTPPYVFNPYPRFLPYLDGVGRDRLVYLNYDDYTAGVGADVGQRAEEEARLLAEAGTIICASRYQKLRFSERYPLRCEDFFHVPHGVHQSFLNPAPDTAPEPNTVCSMGRLSARYDWGLIQEVVTDLPETKFLFVGEVVRGPSDKGDVTWESTMDAVLGMENVSHVAGVPYRSTLSYYWNSAVNWMPYGSDLAFVKASCPLKLMDGIASGRPVVSADVPECRLYPEWVHVYEDAAEAVSMLRVALAGPWHGEKAERARRQVEFARLNSATARARRVIEILDRKRAGELERTAGGAGTCEAE